MYVTGSGRSFVGTDGVDRGFFCLPSSSYVVFCGWSPAVPVFFLSIAPSPFEPLGSLWGGCGRQGTSGLHPRVSHVHVDLAAGI